jgi:hypothetical protein
LGWNVEKHENKEKSYNFFKKNLKIKKTNKTPKNEKKQIHLKSMD